MEGLQSSFVAEDENNIEEHWVGMPEYNNVFQEKPVITATIKFASEKDFLEFNELLKKYVYKTNKVFDGMQRKEEKSAWFPLKEKASNYIYTGKDES